MAHPIYQRGTTALVTIVLHIVALWSGFPISWRNAKALLVPYGYVDGADGTGESGATATPRSSGPIPGYTP